MVILFAFYFLFFFSWYGDHRDLHVLTHSFPTRRSSDLIVARVPVVRSLYSWTKQLLETVLSQTSTAFREVVLIEYPRRGCWAVGFITGETVGEVDRKSTRLNSSH